MDRSLINKYVTTIENLKGKDFLIAVLKYNVSPVFEGKKPASIITLDNYRRNLKELWEKYKDCIFQEKVIEYFELKSSKNATTLLIYNKGLLKQTLLKREIKEFLQLFDYDNYDNTEEILNIIKSRYSKRFPHEIGVILGIPIEDVKAFIIGEDTKCVMNGYWKVFNDVEGARRIFKTYDDIREKAIYEIINSNIKN